MIKLLSLSPAWVERSVDRLFQILGGLLVALGDADKADVVAFEARAHAAHWPRAVQCQSQVCLEDEDVPHRYAVRLFAFVLHHLLG
jgi:hypothetical protein